MVKVEGEIDRTTGHEWVEISLSGEITGKTAFPEFSQHVSQVERQRLLHRPLRGSSLQPADIQETFPI